MIRYSLKCTACASEFEAWFRVSTDFDAQKNDGLLECPNCGSIDINKQIMAPAVKPSSPSGASDSAKMMQLAADYASKAKAYVSKNFDYVGTDFAKIATQAARGEIAEPARPIWGETTVEQREKLADEGVQALPLPEALTPPKPVPKDKLN